MVTARAGDEQLEFVTAVVKAGNGQESPRRLSYESREQ